VLTHRTAAAGKLIGNARTADGSDKRPAADDDDDETTTTTTGLSGDSLRLAASSHLAPIHPLLASLLGGHGRGMHLLGLRVCTCRHGLPSTGRGRQQMSARWFTRRCARPLHRRRRRFRGAGLAFHV